MGLTAYDVSLVMQCIKDLYPYLDVPPSVDYEDFGGRKGGKTSGWSRNITLDKRFSGPLNDGDMAGLTITAMHEVMHRNQSFIDFNVTKILERMGDESHNDEAFEMVQKKNVFDCVMRKRKGQTCK